MWVRKPKFGSLCCSQPLVCQAWLFSDPPETGLHIVYSFHTVHTCYLAVNRPVDGIRLLSIHKLQTNNLLIQNDLKRKTSHRESSWFLLVKEPVRLAFDQKASVLDILMAVQLILMVGCSDQLGLAWEGEQTAKDYKQIWLSEVTHSVYQGTQECGKGLYKKCNPIGFKL